MKKLDFSNKVVLITGGTRGIGLATALHFARCGAKCILTYRWGDHDEEAIYEKFADFTRPLILQANVADGNDTKQLFATLKEKVLQIDVFISNVSVAALIKTFEDYTFKSLKQSIQYSSWPVVNYSMKIKEVFGKYPRYIVGVSSTGPDSYSFGYDFVAASKTVLEVLCRYLSYRLKNDSVVNVVRSRAIKTESLEDIFGKDFKPFVDKFIPENYWIEPDEVASSIVALCSGYCDIIQGQTINVDRGTDFFDNIMEIYTRQQML